MQTYQCKTLIIMNDDNSVLYPEKHMDLATLTNEAQHGAIIVWNYKGLYLVLCNAALCNYVRLADRKHQPLVPIEFTILPRQIAALLFA